eukprot:710558-Rhodomonas_salina.4
MAAEVWPTGRGKPEPEGTEIDTLLVARMSEPGCGPGVEKGQQWVCHGGRRVPRSVRDRGGPGGHGASSSVTAVEGAGRGRGPGRPRLPRAQPAEAPSLPPLPPAGGPATLASPLCL